MTAANHQPNETPTANATLDPEEVQRFSRLASEWWNPNGKFRPLHQIGPPRLSFIRDRVVANFNLDAPALRPLAGLTALDIGCGGGLVSEPLARMGAIVTAIDPSERNIAIAKGHAEAQKLDIDYRADRGRAASSRRLGEDAFQQWAGALVRRVPINRTPHTVTRT